MDSIANFIIATISTGGYVGIAGLMAIESACNPLPSEIIMPFAGYLVSAGRFSLPVAATAGAVGCSVGSALAYEVGARGGRRMVERWGTWVLLDRNEFDRMNYSFCALWQHHRADLPTTPSFVHLLPCQRASPACRSFAFTSTLCKFLALVLSSDIRN
ncbi:MAG: hypothetical protein QOH05_2447 [Acetobacteraceae bacterium]|nr:hypothetical protein [Acetobacteraceae bacterium]